MIGQANQLSRRHARRLVIPTILCCLLTCDSVDAASGRLKFWVRAEGNYGEMKIPLSRTATLLDVTQLNVVDIERFDLQYNRVGRYRGVDLKSLIFKYRPKTADLALLHFANGMIVPYLLGERMPRVFLAFSRFDQYDGDWKQHFNAIRKITPRYVDIRPLRFSGSKLVVEKSTHPMVPGSDKPQGFSPWRYVDTLIGVEYVRQRAYYQQFDIAGNPMARTGFRIFKENCQFCHGAKGVGAQYGWDFVKPYPLYKLRPDGKCLYYRVAYQSEDAPARGLMMPAMKHIGKNDASRMWRWMKVIATWKMSAYSPH